MGEQRGSRFASILVEAEQIAQVDGRAVPVRALQNLEGHGAGKDVRALASARTNEARFDALTAMLRARNLTFAVESFTIPKPIREMDHAPKAGTWLLVYR